MKSDKYLITLDELRHTREQQNGLDFYLENRLNRRAKGAIRRFLEGCSLSLCKPWTPELFAAIIKGNATQEQLEEAKVFAGVIYYHMFERDLCASGANLVGTAFVVSDRFTNFIAREFLHMKKLIPFV